MQYEASMTVYIGRTANQRKVTKWLSFKKTQNDWKSNHHILGVYDHIHTKDGSFYEYLYGQESMYKKSIKMTAIWQLQVGKSKEVISTY